MPRGGARQGLAGKKYGNRTDLALGPRKLPVTTAPNQPYGEAGQQAASQQQVPMASGPLPQHQDIMASAQQFNPPPVVPIGAPTMNPAEHVMTPAPVAQAPLAQSPAVKGAALLASFGENAPLQVKALRDALNVAAMNGSGA